MSFQPSLNELMAEVDNKYSMVVAIAKRARQITENGGAVVDLDTEKNVSRSMKELAESKLQWRRADKHR